MWLPSPQAVVRLALQVWFAFAVPAQEDAPPADAPPERIGLVLSGGGARGCAHVGVLKVLEEMRIPIHCVAGTSMGSIVGGLYAYGLSPERLEQELTRAGARRPWSQLLQDQPPRTDRTFRRKQEDFDFLVDIGLGFRDGAFRLPKGLVQGQNLELELLSLAPEGHALANFDELPIPFRAVAVELRNGQRVVLCDGNLAFAMRASMSLPGVFAPAVRDGVELLDGGLAENVPIDLARAMGATRLIVVDIGTPVSAQDIDSALGVSSQMVQILTQQNVDRSLKLLRPVDVFLQPDLGDITSADFERAAESIRIGEATARAAREQLATMSVSEEEYERFLAGQRRKALPITVRELRIDNRSGLGDELVRTRLRVKEGRALDIEALRAEIERLYGLGDFEKITFELVPAADGQHDVVLHVTAKSWGPTHLRFGLALSSNLEGRSAFTLGTQVNMRKLNELGAEWRSAVQLGDVTGIDSEFYQPLVASGRLFVAPRVQTLRRELVAQGVATLEARIYQAGLDAGVNVGTWGELRVGASRITGDVDVDSLLPIGGLDFDDGLVDVRFVADTLDLADFPGSGLRGGVQWVRGYAGLGADVEYQQADVSGVAYVSSGRTALGFGAVVSTELEGTVPLYRRPALGGFTLLSGLDPGTIGGEHVGFGGLILRHRLAGREAEVLGFPLYIGGTFEAGNAWATRDALFTSFVLAGSAFLAVDTPLGPTYLAYGYAEGGEQSFYMFVGQVF